MGGLRIPVDYLPSVNTDGLVKNRHSGENRSPGCL